MILSSLFQRGRCERAKNRTRERAAERFRPARLADVDAHTFPWARVPGFSNFQQEHRVPENTPRVRQQTRHAGGTRLDGEATEGTVR
jgi:hypothetical protein